MNLLLVLLLSIPVMHCSYIPHDVLMLGEDDDEDDGEVPPACDS